jgi:iron(III) transport system ATP-binding protein
MIPLRLEHVTKRFGRVVAVDDVSLAVEPGELFFLLGPSGCGKTTLLRVIAGFYAPDGGRVFFGDADATSRPPHRRNCGMVFQNYALWPHMSVLDNVAFGLGVRGVRRSERRRRALEVLGVVQMADFARRKPTQLSGGQQQRVALARALAIEPDYLLLDEPLSNLDAKLRLQMRTEIRRMQRAHRVTSIYVTHDQDEALSMADRLAVVCDGRIVALGTPRDLYRDPPTAWVAGFLGATNLLKGRLTGCREDAAQITAPFGTLRAGRAPPGADVGQDVTVSVRPEDLRLVPPDGAAPAENVFDVAVLARTFQGETEQVRVRLGPHEVVISGRPTDLPAAEAGERARLFMPAEAIHVYAGGHAAVSASPG